MIDPPFQRSDDDMERPSHGPGPWVWLVVAAIAILLAAAQLYAIGKTPGVTPDRQLLDTELAGLQTEWMSSDPLADFPPVTKKFAEAAEKRLGRIPLKTQGAKGARARANLILEQATDPAGKPDFSGLSHKADDFESPEARIDVSERRQKLNAALREVYAAKKLSEAQANRLKETIAGESGSPWPIVMALHRVDELSGQVASKADKLIAAVIFMVLIALGIGAWFVYAVYRGRGNLPLGIPLQGAGPDVGDGLGLRMIIFFMLFAFAPGVVAVLAPPSWSAAWTDAFARVVLLFLLWAVMTVPMLGRVISFRDVGWRTQNLGKDILVGVWAFLANLPIVLALAYLGSVLLDWIPSGGHPVQMMIMQPGAQIPLLLSASILTAMLEETAFRGLFFQGLQLRLRNTFWAVFLSSLAFAAIHPQGGALWPTLAWIGAMGAMVTRERKSLVPAIVMHTLHNGTLLALAIYAL
ncbi:MAG: CPBP family intramembrane metalloprotease [Armatimonadetes bacterium]|nr:CPBP family intramembrane metalloprotease [Armatimonadota bacterium]